MEGLRQTFTKMMEAGTEAGKRRITESRDDECSVIVEYYIAVMMKCLTRQGPSMENQISSR